MLQPTCWSSPHTGGCHKLSSAFGNQQGLCYFQVAILESCRDRNIVQFLGSCTEGGQTLLITE